MTPSRLFCFMFYLGSPLLVVVDLHDVRKKQQDQGVNQPAARGRGISRNNRAGQSSPANTITVQLTPSDPPQRTRCVRT